MRALDTTSDQYVRAKPPVVGVPVAVTDFGLEEFDVNEDVDSSSCLVHVIYLSVDPYEIHVFNAIPIGSTMRGAMLVEIETCSDICKCGQIATFNGLWKRRFYTPATNLRVLPADLPPAVPYYLGPLGMQDDGLPIHRGHRQAQSWGGRLRLCGRRCGRDSCGPVVEVGGLQGCLGW